jgi:hypothetical protein
MARTVGLKTIAKRSFSLRRGDVAAQVEKLPADHVGVMSLGLNDAADPVQHLAKSIEKVVDVLVSSGRRIVWVGPPCVLKAWDNRASELDQHLRQRLAGTAIEYVSLRDEAICAPRLRTRDGEHFTVEGYKYVWEKIRRDSKLAAGLQPDPCELARAEAVYRGRKAADCAASVATSR